MYSDLVYLWGGRGWTPRLTLCSEVLSDGEKMKRSAAELRCFNIGSGEDRDLRALMSASLLNSDMGGMETPEFG
jgi:hypothetical protein